jgi:hypothetical protein
MNLGALAQLVEQRTFNPFVVGSTPAGPTRFLKRLTENSGAFLFLWRITRRIANSPRWRRGSLAGAVGHPNVELRATKSDRVGWYACCHGGLELTRYLILMNSSSLARRSGFNVRRNTPAKALPTAPAWPHECSLSCVLHPDNRSPHNRRWRQRSGRRRARIWRAAWSSAACRFWWRL